MDRQPRDVDERRERAFYPASRPGAPMAPVPGHQGDAGSTRYYLLEFLAVFFTLFAGGVVLLAFSDRAGEAWTIPELFATVLRDVGFCMLVWVLLTRRGPFDWRLPRAAVKWAEELGWALLLILAIFGCNYILSLLIFPLDLESSPTHWASPLANPATLATFCLFTPIVGLSEELLFRVYVQTRLTRVLRGNNVLPVLIGVVLFAVVHGYPLVGTLRVGVIGVVLGVSYQANGKIPRLVIAHILWNLMVALLTLVPD